MNNTTKIVLIVGYISLKGRIKWDHAKDYYAVIFI